MTRCGRWDFSTINCVQSRSVLNPMWSQNLAFVGFEPYDKRIAL